MSNLHDHMAEQAEITALCESGACDHPECKDPLGYAFETGEIDHLSPADLRKYDEAMADANEDAVARMIEPTVWYFVREYSEGEAFPEVHIFQTEDEARAAMIAEALEAAALLDGWVTEEIDGPAITECLIHGWGTFATRVTALNVERGTDGAVDCFRLFSQDVNQA